MKVAINSLCGGPLHLQTQIKERAKKTRRDFNQRSHGPTYGSSETWIRPDRSAAKSHATALQKLTAKLRKLIAAIFFYSAELPPMIMISPNSPS
jgi:hypothetical protein